jgi:hypothetical protein
MPARLRAWLAAGCLALAMLATPAHAGTACVEKAPSPAAVAAAAATALQMRDALEAEDAPVALLARAGTDLHKYGLHYSHVAFVVRDHRAGRWTVVHLLNDCGTAHSALYAQGLINYFVDNLVSQDARLVWLPPDQTERLAQLLTGPQVRALHEARYNVIARPDSRRTQNSTAWVLEMLAASRLPPGAPLDRRAAQAAAIATGHVPDHIHIPYSRRVLGGLFSANTDFTDHPVATRLSGDYPVVTVRSILRWLQASGAVRREREWIDGREQAQPGPA